MLFFATRTRRLVAIVILAVAIITATLGTPVSAHEGRDVGDFNLVVGFLREPAYEGHLNAVSLVVTRAGHLKIEGDGAPEMKMETEGEGHDADRDGSADAYSTKPDDQVDSMTARRANEVDVVTHGAVFISPGIGRMEDFEFEVTEELVGVEIPYHVHPGDQEGVIGVSTADSQHGEDQSIMIMDGQLMPAKLEVNVGDTVVWMNHESQNAVIMSGPLTSMTSEMTTKLGLETPSVTAQTLPTSDRVTGLASTLQVEVAHIPTSASRVMPLTEVFNDPGHYVAEFVPTAPGDYRMRFFGSIEGNAVDETFDSRPDTFDTVVPSDAIQFPVVLESNREIQNATQGALDTVQELEADIDATSSTASVGMIVGIVGMAFGVIATAMSIFAVTIARRRD